MGIAMKLNKDNFKDFKRVYQQAIDDKQKWFDFAGEKVPTVFGRFALNHGKSMKWDKKGDENG